MKTKDCTAAPNRLYNIGTSCGFALAIIAMNKNLLWLFAGLVGVLFMAAILFPVFAQARLSNGPSCLWKIKMIDLGLLTYANDHDDKMPPATTWMDSIQFWISKPSYFSDRQFVEPGQYGYAYRDKASTLRISALPTPNPYAVIYDSSHLQRNAHDELKSLPHPGRHNGRDNIGYIDGHARAVPMP